MPPIQLEPVEKGVEESEEGDEDEEKEEEEVTIIPKPRKYKRVASKPVRKGKAAMEYPENPKKKKRKSKIDEVRRRKRKLLDESLWRLRK